jgi:hypothetical protein
MLSAMSSSIPINGTDVRSLNMNIGDRIRNRLAAPARLGYGPQSRRYLCFGSGDDGGKIRSHSRRDHLAGQRLDDIGINPIEIEIIPAISIHLQIDQSRGKPRLLVSGPGHNRLHSPIGDEYLDGPSVLRV